LRSVACVGFTQVSFGFGVDGSSVEDVKFWLLFVVVMQKKDGRIQGRKAMLSYLNSIGLGGCRYKSDCGRNPSFLYRSSLRLLMMVVKVNFVVAMFKYFLIL
jgi:hypothetical protein